MRILGLDVGTKTIGVAVSDELGIAAHALRTLPRTGNRRDADAIGGVVSETGATEIVVGVPLPVDGGDEGSQARRARAFADVLRARLGLPIHLVDESFTTVDAEAVLLEADLSRAKRKQVIDRLAAAKILQRWMDRR